MSQIRLIPEENLDGIKTITVFHTIRNHSIAVVNSLQEVEFMNINSFDSAMYHSFSLSEIDMIKSIMKHFDTIYDSLIAISDVS